MSKEEILGKYRLYILPGVFGKEGPVNKVSFDGALKAMDEYADQQTQQLREDKETLMQHVENQNISYARLSEQLQLVAGKLEKKDQENKRLREASEAQKAYIDFLDYHVTQLSGMAHIHGYRPSADEINKGIELRKAISDAALSPSKETKDFIEDRWAIPEGEQGEAFTPIGAVHTTSYAAQPSAGNEAIGFAEWIKKECWMWINDADNEGSGGWYNDITETYYPYKTITAEQLYQLYKSKT